MMIVFWDMKGYDDSVLGHEQVMMIVFWDMKSYDDSVLGHEKL